jgi:hypothetical protein
LELANSDMIDSGAALKLGKILTAPYLLTGSITAVFGSVKIQAKIIRTETTEIMASAFVSAAPAEVEGLTKELLGEKGKITSSLFRSMVVPGWGQIYADHPVRGAISLAAVLGAAGYTGYCFYKSGKAYNKYQSYESFSGSPTFWDSLRTDTITSHKSWPQVLHDDSVRSLSNWSQYETAYDRAIFMTLVSIGVYALNLLDATIAGAQSKRKFSLYFSGNFDNSYHAGICLRF